MSTINRRAFAMGCLAVPLAGCHNLKRVSLNRVSLTGIAGSSAPSDIRFKNPGNWVNIGNTNIGDTWVFVVSGPIPVPS
jgi:hypothetical protein